MSRLTIRFEGYWQCRQATDPDPSRDPRGASGYTFAIGNENDLDSFIRLQRDEIADVDFRRAWPPPNYPASHALAGDTDREDRFGVFVSGIELDGEAYGPGTEALVRGKVRWLPSHGPDVGPRFELRNTITFNPGNNEGIFMPVDPFHIMIESEDGGVRIGRNDPLDPRRPEDPIWKMGDSELYRRRCPVKWNSDSDVALTAIGLTRTIEGSPYLAYFQQRREWLELELTEAEEDIARISREGGDPTEAEVERAAILNRLYVIKEFTSEATGFRLANRLGLLAGWDHTLLGGDITTHGTATLGGRILIGEGDEWRTTYWMGAFDGDTMRGYMRGTLQVPFEKA